MFCLIDYEYKFGMCELIAMIAFDRVSKTYHGRHLHKQVLAPTSFAIEPGDALGLCGANGAGKSTTVSWPIGYTSCFQSSLTGADNARFIARIYRQPAQPLLDFVEDFAQLGEYLHQPVKTYSAGMHARLAFGISLAIDFDCYLVDEVTGAGDERFQARCHEALVYRRNTGTLVMVSHSPEIMRQYCKRGAVLRDGALSLYDTIDEALCVHHASQQAA